MPQRVAILTTSYPSHAGDAAGGFVQTEARALSRAGREVLVVAPGAGDPGDPGVCVVRVPDRGASGFPGLLVRLAERPWRALGLFGFALGARRALLSRGPFDQLFAHFLVPTGFPIALGLRRSARHLEIIAHGSDVGVLERLPAALGRRILRSALCSGATLRCVSQDLAGRLERMHGRPLGDRLRIEPAPIDVAAAPDRAAAREVLAIDPGARLLLVVGRLIPEKRVATALRATRLLEGIDVVVLGDGPEGAALRQAFPEVRFLGQVAHPLSLTWIRASDAVVTASRSEGAPLALREARALGVPVVSLAAGDLRAWSAQDPGLWVVG